MKLDFKALIETSIFIFCFNFIKVHKISLPEPHEILIHVMPKFSFL